MVKRSKYKRGYPVAIIVGLDERTASIWKVYSQVVKPEATVHLEGNRNNSRNTYNFHETIINAIRPTLNEGIRSALMVSPSRTNFTKEFVDHIKKHHAWLTQGTSKIALAETAGSANSLSDVAALTKNPILHKLIQDATSQETENLLDLIETKLGRTDDNTYVLYSIQEIEDAIIYSRKTNVKPELLLLTNNYLSKAQKGRINRLMQIAANKKVKTRVVDAETAAGKRINQLGGIVCIIKPA